MIQRLNEESGHKETLYQANGDDASKADRAWAIALTADRRLRSWLLTLLNFT